MKLKTFIGWSSALCLSLGALQAEETTNDAGNLSRQLQQLQDQQRQMRENFERLLREQQAQIDALKLQLEAATTNGLRTPAPVLPEAQSVPAATSPPPATPPEAGPPWTPSSPLRLRSGTAYLDLGLSATFAAGTSTAEDIEGGTQLGGHDPNQRGFTVQGVELSLAGAVDPFFRGSANLLFSMDSSGESFFELEEAWLETLSLPANLQLRAGQFLTEFGRQNTTHPHAWAFVDTPLVLGRFLGPDGLRNPGARLSWLAPTPFYSELFFSIQNSQGETAASFRGTADGHGHESADELPFAYRHPENDRGVEGLVDLLLTPRYAVSFDLTDSQTLLAGVSAAFGPNSSGAPDGGDTMTEIYGVDLTWKWKPPTHNAGFPFVSFQTEALLRRYQAGRFNWDENGDGVADPGEIVDLGTGRPAMLRNETLVDYGFYAQALYGFRRGWVAGLRFDYVDSDPASYESGLSLDGEPLGRDPQRAERWRLSPNLTWYPSEYSKIRLQYNYDERHSLGRDHSIWLQFEFLLGAHAAHTF